MMTLLVYVVNVALFFLVYTVVFVVLTLMGYATVISASDTRTLIDSVMTSVSALLLVAVALLYLKRVLRAVGVDPIVVLVTIVLVAAEMKRRLALRSYQVRSLRSPYYIGRAFHLLFVLAFLGGIGFLCLAAGISEFKVEFISPEWFGPVLVTGLMLFAISMLWFFLSRHDRG